jgi:peptidoglycan/LPS O-acetylase OafA/YrhL
MSRTSLALTNLRGYAILIVLAFHSCIAYIVSQPASALPFDAPPYGWLGNPIVDQDRWLGFDLFCAMQFLYMMQLMFFLSGLFVWPSLQRKGPASFLYDRFMRLGVPFLLGAYLLMPIVYYPVYRVTAVDPSWMQFWTHWRALPFWPSGPLWFLAATLALNLVAAGLYQFVPRLGEWLTRLAAKAAANPIGFFVVLVTVTALAYVPLARAYTPWQWVRLGPFAIQTGFAPQYAIYFFAGVVLGATGLERGLFRSDGPLPQQWRRWVAGAAAAFVVWIVPTALNVKGGASLPGLQIVADFGLVLYAASACIGLSAVFLRFAAGRRPIFEGVAENAYGIYLLHYLFVIWAQFTLLHIALSGFFKGAIVFAATLVLSWAVSAALCRTAIGNRLIGSRQRVTAGAKRAESEQTAA